MRAILAMSLKDLRLLLRDRPAMFFTVFFPVIFAAVFGMIYSGMGGRTSAVRIVVVDHADNAASRALVQRLDAQEVLETDAAPDDDAARALVQGGRRSACLIIPSDYGDWSSTLLSGRAASLAVGIDPSRLQERAMIEGLVSQAAYENLSTAFREPDSMQSLARQARSRLADAPGMSIPERLAVEAMLGNLDHLSESIRARQAAAASERPDAGASPGSPGNSGFSPIAIGVTEITGQKRSDWHTSAFSVTFAQGVVWALIGCAAAYSMSLVIERTGGTLLRLRAAPLSGLCVIAGKSIACTLTTLLACGLLIILGTLAFGLRIGQPIMLAAALLASTTAFVGIMMVLSSVGKTPRAAGPIGYAVLLTMAILGGGMMPHFMMPAWMQRVGLISPVQWTVISVENAVFRGASWGQEALPLAVLLGIGVAGMLVGAALFARAKD